ncbi:hypothetical protein [Pseudomonas sp. 210_17 TE3656]
METHWIRLSAIAFSVTATLILLTGCDQDAPGSSTAAGPRPSTILAQYKLHSPPPLASAADVPKFLDWAGASHVDEKEDARTKVVAAASNNEIIQAFIDEIERVQVSDQTRALLALALLGETHSPGAESFFAEFAIRPLPNEGAVVDGEIIEQTRAAQLQAKAVDGLAYFNNERTNTLVMEIVRNHPSKIVRAEAINAYLWNHGDSDAARRMLSHYVRNDESIFLDRVRRNPGERAESFNRKLEQFLVRHPDVVPPSPEKSQAEQNSATTSKAFDVKPPEF